MPRTSPRRKARDTRFSTPTPFPEHAWIDGYYDALEPRAKALAEHDNEDVRNFAAETLDEIDIFRRSDGSYGYVLYILQRN